MIILMRKQEEELDYGQALEFLEKEIMDQDEEQNIDNN